MENGYINIGNNVFETLFAISDMEQSRGLMWQSWPPPVMSFIYSKPCVNKFWMKNTPSALDILFINKNTIVGILKGEPNSTSIIDCGDMTDMVVELPHGYCKAFDIKVGDDVNLVSPTKDELKSIISKKYPWMNF